jgi:hypothetical protein
VTHIERSKHDLGTPNEATTSSRLLTYKTTNVISKIAILYSVC